MKNLQQSRNGLTVGRVSKLLATVNRAKMFIVLLTTLLIFALSETAFGATKPIATISVGTQSGTVTYGTGGSVTFPITITWVKGTAGSATLFVTGLTADVTATWSAGMPISGTTSVTCTLTTTAAAAVTTNTSFTVNTTDGAITGAGTLAITPKSLTITANNQAKCNGDLLTFSGYEFTPTGLVKGETVGSVALASAGSSPGVAAGSYSIVPTDAAANGMFLASNYSITYVNGTLTVGNKWLGYSEEWGDENNWCGGSVPINTTDVIIPSGSVNYPTISEAAVCNNITIQSGATLVDNSLLTISGTAYVQQYLASDRNWYVSSPVETAPATDLTTATSVVCYNEATAGWVPPKDGTLTPLQGYISVATKTDGAITFSGKLNTGTKSTSLLCTSGTKAGFNLVGNPYPSYVNIEDAPKTNLLDTYWYRSQNGSKTYVFDTYGLTSHFGTNNSGLGAATKYIPPMQAFWVRVATIAGGTIGFTNLNRGHKADTNNPLRAPSASKVTQQVLRLQVSNGVNSDETIIAFNPNASNSYDAYDSQKQSNGSAAVPEIYTMAGTEQVAINGLKTLIPDEELPLGFTTGQSNAFTIKATEMSGFDSGLRIILKDNLLNTEQDLTANNTYTFSSDVVNTTDRFTLLFKAPGSATGLNTGSNDQSVLVYKNADNQITVKCSGDVTNENSVVVYNGVGQRLLAKQLAGNVTVLDSPLTSGVYMVTVTNAGKSVTKKVILN